MKGNNKGNKNTFETKICADFKELLSSCPIFVLLNFLPVILLCQF